jgi:hypothetical protein
VLLAVTIDPDRSAVVRTQYYRQAVNNLVKIRRDRALVEVDGHWVPAETTFEIPGAEPTTRVVWSWRTLPEVPLALFAPRGLARPSGLTWP